MGTFEYFFTFLGLMLGLALANIAGGFGRLWRVQSIGKVGFCLPLLALLILFRIISIWRTTYTVLPMVEITTISLFVAVGTALPYVLISTLMFPDDSKDWVDLDDYYLKHARVLLIALALPPLLASMGYAYLAQVTLDVWEWTKVIGLMVTPVALMLVWRKLWVHRTVLALMALDELRFLIFQ